MGRRVLYFVGIEWRALFVMSSRLAVNGIMSDLPHWRERIGFSEGIPFAANHFRESVGKLGRGPKHSILLENYSIQDIVSPSL